MARNPGNTALRNPDPPAIQQTAALKSVLATAASAIAIEAACAFNPAEPCCIWAVESTTASTSSKTREKRKRVHARFPVMRLGGARHQQHRGEERPVFQGCPEFERIGQLHAVARAVIPECFATETRTPETRRRAGAARLGHVSESTAGLMTARTAQTRRNITVQDSRTATASRRPSLGTLLLRLANPTVTAVLDARPPTSPVRTIPFSIPSI